MESNTPFAQRLDTNYVPTPAEIDQINQLIDKSQASVDAIDAEIAELQRRRKVHTDCIHKHQALTTPVRRLHPDVLSSIFLKLVDLADRDRRPGPHPAVTISHVCRQWRDLALNTPMMWTTIDIQIPLFPTESDLPPTADPSQTLKYAAEYLALVEMWKERIQLLSKRVLTFAQRSKECPVSVSYTAFDPPLSVILDMLSADDHPARGWSMALQPLRLAAKRPNLVWKSFSMHVRMYSDVSIHIAPLRIVQEHCEGLRNLEIDIVYFCHAGSQSEGSWEDFLPQGRIDVQRAPLTSLTARMPYADICRLDMHWDALSTLSIGAPHHSIVFGAQEATNILSLTPNLVHCTIEFSIGPSQPAFLPQRQTVGLPHLESLVMLGSAPPVDFVVQLDLPSLTQLSAIHFADPVPENKDPVVELVRRYGSQLTDISFAYTSLTPTGLTFVLEHLPNVVSLEMESQDQRALSMRLNPNPAEPLPARDDDATTKLNVVLLQRLTPKFNETRSELSEECMCPKIQTLTCKLGKGHGPAVKRHIVDLIVARRSVSRNDGPVAWLGQVQIAFKVGPTDFMMEELQKRGVTTNGISFTARYPDELSVPCSLSLPIPGMGSFEVAMEIGPLGCIHAQHQAGLAF